MNRKIKTILQFVTVIVAFFFFFLYFPFLPLTSTPLSIVLNYEFICLLFWNLTYPIFAILNLHEYFTYIITESKISGCFYAFPHKIRATWETQLVNHLLFSLVWTYDYSFASISSLSFTPTVDYFDPDSFLKQCVLIYLEFLSGALSNTVNFDHIISTVCSIDLCIWMIMDTYDFMQYGLRKLLFIESVNNKIMDFTIEFMTILIWFIMDSQQQIWEFFYPSDYSTWSESTFAHIYTNIRNFTQFFAIKFIVVIAFVVIIRSGTPRYRFDYLTKLGWLKFLGFTLAILLLVILFFFLW